MIKTVIEQFAALLFNTQITDATGCSLAVEAGLQETLSQLETCRSNAGTVYIIGNGGSAAIASHAVIDFLNMVKMRAMAMLDSAVTTCISNDYGYEYVYERQLRQFVKKGDVLIAISSSGKSKNILNAVTAARECEAAHIITLSGFASDNPLRSVGDTNIWLDSKDYGQVEIGHAFILHHITDRLKQC